MEQLLEAGKFHKAMAVLDASGDLDEGHGPSHNGTELSYRSFNLSNIAYFFPTTLYVRTNYFFPQT